MELYYLEIAGKLIISVMVIWVVYIGINKWRVWTPMKYDPNPIKKDDLTFLPSSSIESGPPSTTTNKQQKYDVFLSFRGPDTRRGITTDLYHELQNRGISAFMDDQDLEIGARISPSLLMAIEESRFAIVILSQNYASSPWCLEELAKIVQCKGDHDRILPLFYDVDPSDVRHQKRNFEIAFRKYEKKSRHNTDKLNQWRNALKNVANLSGWDSKNFKSDRELVKVIVESMWSRLQPIEYESSMSTGDFVEFGATRQAMHEVMEALKDEKVTVVGVYGMGGVGKTTMVKRVGELARKTGVFDHVIIAVISQIPDLIKIQETLADLLGVKLEEVTEMGRAARLNKEIWKRKKILIILDDVWNSIELSSIGVPSYDKLKTCNSKVLLTCRRQHICHLMQCEAGIHLNILSEEDSFNLFVKKTRKCFKRSPIFYEIGRRVARECCGLPIALITVARALGDKDIKEWEKATRRLEKSQTANPDDEGDASKCIRLSFDYLRDEDHKSCFLLCCLFPEDYNINIEKLFGYAIGRELFGEVDTMQEARDTLESVVLYLKDSSLLLESEKDGCVKMHDVVRDTGIQITQDVFLVRAGCGLIEFPRRLHEGYSAVSLMVNAIRKLPEQKEQLVFSKLQILLLQDNVFLQEIPETFFPSLSELRVLDLSETSISFLPKSSSLLINLQALYLDRCKSLDDITIVGKLEKLEILSMRYSGIRELPREMEDLTSLKIFDITASNIDRIPSKVISKLHRLEELYMRDFLGWGSNVEGQEPNASFEEVTSLPNLRVLWVTIYHVECIPKAVEFDPNWVEFDIIIGQNKLPWRNFTRSRMVDIDTNCTLPSWFCNVVISKAEWLVWWNHRLSDIFVLDEHDSFNGLKHLFFWAYKLEYSGTARTYVPKHPVLENLEELELHSQEELCLDELAPRSLFNLKALKVINCKNWGNVLFPAKLRLPNLEILLGQDMHQIEYVFGYEDFQPQESKLRELNLSFLVEIRSLCNGPAPLAMFQSLKLLSIQECGFQGSLFTSDVAQCLLHLEEINLFECDFIQRIVEASNKQIIFPKLKRLDLRNLPELCYESSTIDFECPLLEKLDVDDCPQFLLLFPTSATDQASRNWTKAES